MTETLTVPVFAMMIAGHLEIFLLLDNMIVTLTPFPLVVMNEGMCTMGLIEGCHVIFRIHLVMLIIDLLTWREIVDSVAKEGITDLGNKALSALDHL